MSANSQTIDTGVIIRRSLFFLTLIILTLAQLFILFRGLNTQQAMDQAQIGREIARGKGMTTKFIRPVAYHQAQEAKGTVPFTAFEDTYHAPLNPLILGAVFKVIGAEAPADWTMQQNQLIFPLDRVVAAVSTLFFLMAIGVNYLLISRIFDQKIAGITAVLMLFCQTYWGFALSGLPQMLLLLFFSCGSYFAYRAVEATSEGRVAYTHAMVSGIFFILMALTHWLAIWVVFGYIIFAAFAFRPRGIVALTVLALLALAAVPTVIRCNNHSHSVFGTGFLSLYKGLGDTSTEDAVMRTDDLGSTPLRLDGMFFKILRTTVLQATDIIPFLAGIVVAPIFFISLFHGFKRPSIANFRWGIFCMWVLCAMGTAIFGVTAKELDSNQIHLVFAPIMTAYGLAFLSILWSRLDVVINTPALRNLHLVIICLVCASPLLLDLPQKIRLGMDHREKGGVPWWPPYYAPAMNLALRSWIKEDQICFSDQPWAVAWYADRVSIWLPTTKTGFEKLERKATDLGSSPVGILVTPSSHGSKDIRSLSEEYGDFTSLVINGRVFLATYPPGISIFDKDPKLQTIVKKYAYPQPVVGMDVVYYSDRPLRSSDAKLPQ